MKEDHSLFYDSQYLSQLIKQCSYKIYYMIGKLSVLTLLLVLGSCQWTNTTAFWQKELKIEPSFEAFSGFEEIDQYYPKGASGMHYQLFSGHGTRINSSDYSHLPLFVWLQGGPGLSSMFGAYAEVGPISIKNGTPVLNEWSWNMLGHILFIDSPLNVGFSYSNLERNGTKQVNSTDEATDHLINFFKNFYKRWPTLKQNPLYLVGEQYAGHYIPNLAKKIIQRHSQLNFNLKGVIIGDGWTDPVNQVNFYDDYLWSLGVVSSKQRDVCEWYQTNSILNIYRKQYQKATNYFDFLANNDTAQKSYMGNVSIINFRNSDEIDISFAYYLYQNKHQFGVPAGIQYIPQNQKIYTAFGQDISKSYSGDVALILSQVRTLIYNSQNDVLVNTPGVLQYLNSMRWSGSQQWKRTKKRVWKINGKVHGWAKVHENLWFVLVNGAGQLVASDQPLPSIVMLDHFLHSQNDWDL